MAKSTLKDQIRLCEFLSSNNIEGAKVYYAKFPDILTESVAYGKHLMYATNPLYALVGTQATKENKEAIDYVLATNPDVINHVAFRCAILPYVALNRDDPELIEKIIKLGADINDQSRYDDMNWKIYKPSYSTAAHIAAQTGKAKTLEMLIKYGANLNLKNVADCTPLDSMLYNTDKVSPDIAKMLIKAGGDVALSDNGQAKGLGYAIYKSAWPAVAEVLKSTKATITKFNMDSIVRGACDSGKLNLKAAEAVFYGLKHMPKDFDPAAYIKSLSKLPNFNDAHKQLIQDLAASTDTFVDASAITSGAVVAHDFELVATPEHSFGFDDIV